MTPPNLLIRPTAVEPREGYKICIQYSDGVAGEIDLSHLAGRGVFEAWYKRACFETARITPDREIAWGKDLELCPDALYLQLTGKSVSEVMPTVQFPR